MVLKAVYLRFFRNYEEVSLSFSSGVNVIWGENAAGKTNLLEAISLISTGRSFRTERLSDVIREGSSFFYIEAEIVKEGVIQIAKLFYDGHQKQLQLNANRFESFSPLLGTLPSALSSPDDTELVTGAPAVRRRFLNIHLAQSDPLYVYHLTRYWRAMKQRNALLRSQFSEIECWEGEMAQSAHYLFEIRASFFQSLKSPLSRISRELSKEQEEVELKPHSNFSPTSYLKQLQTHRAKERELGATLYGPHRDDFSFLVGGKPARLFASEGQKKTAVTALRLAEWEDLADRGGTPPIMALDDFGRPLDAHRQSHLAKAIEKRGQVFLTTPQAPDLWPQAHSIRVEKGAIIAL